MEDLIFTPLVIGFGLMLHQLVLRIHTGEQARWLSLSFIGHVVSAVAQVLLVLYYFPGGGDMLTYFQTGVPAAELLRHDFATFAPELAKAFLHIKDVHLPIELYGGGATASMSALAGFVLFVVGNSLYAAAVLFGVASYVSQVMVFRALRVEFKGAEERAVLIGTMLLPSAVFWSSAMLKEPVVMAALGPLMFGLRMFADGRRRAVALAMLVPGAIAMAMIKPYVLMALSIAAGFFYLKRRSTGRASTFKPSAIVVAAVVGYAGLIAGNRIFSQRTTEGGDGVTVQTLATQRRAGYRVEGGSNYALESQGDIDDPSQRSLQQELVLAPVALLTALFRPLLFEARNAVQFANALEATVLLALAIHLFRRFGWRGLLREISGSPTLLFCLLFTLALGLGTGLASSNLGTLSRYRAPMMPFFFTLLLVLRARSRTVASRSPGAPNGLPRKPQPSPV